MFWEDLATQWRVVGALLIREIYTRFGRESLGFAWIVAEPLVFRRPGPVGVVGGQGALTSTACR